MFNEIFHEKKRKILILISIFLIATLAICMIESVSAYKVEYSAYGNKMDIYFNPTKVDSREGLNQTIDLGNGKIMNLKIYDYRTYKYSPSEYLRYSSTSLYIITSKNVPKMINIDVNWMKDGTTTWGDYTQTFPSYQKWSANEHFNVLEQNSHYAGVYNTLYYTASSWVKVNKITITFDKNIGTFSSSGLSSNNKADLTISKITKKGNTHTVFIKNIGKKNAPKSYLGVYDGKKLIKKVYIQSIGRDKTVQVKVILDKKYKNKIKTFKVDYNNKIKESNKKNNIKKIQ
jgi:hypothetical protein